MLGQYLVQTANGDKGLTVDNHLTLELTRSATLYIAYDNQVTVIPTWLNGWPQVESRVLSNDSAACPYKIYSKTFAPRQVVLDGNRQGGGNMMSNYFVIGVPDPIETPPGGPAFVGVNGLLVVEAESFSENNFRTDPANIGWTITNTYSGFVATGYVTTPRTETNSSLG